MTKPNFESAVVWTTFKNRELPTALRKLAKYIEENPEIKEYDTVIGIEVEYADDSDEWIVSMPTNYWNEPKVIKMIKEKRIRGK